MLLSGCGGSGNHSNSGYGKASAYGGTSVPKRVHIGKSYKIKGIRYYPKYQPDYDKTGLASWYGPGFHGRKTANGERYDQNAMTAAHKTLPIPSIVRVTRLDTGKSIKVRVNDRGPFARGRIIDLSKEAAKRLGTIKHGVAKVRVEYLSGETNNYIASLGLKTPKGWRKGGSSQFAYSTPKPKIKDNKTYAKAPVFDIKIRDVEPYKLTATNRISSSNVKTNNKKDFTKFLDKLDLDESAGKSSANSSYVVQTAAFSSYSNATRHADNIGVIASPSVKEDRVDGKKLYRVLLGPVDDSFAADNILKKAKNMGFADARILVD